MTKVLLAVVGIALLGVSSAGGQAKPEPFRAYVMPSRIETKLPPAGRTGDREILRWLIRDQDGHTFGIGILDCDWYRRERICFGVLRLARGTMVVAGSSFTREFGELNVLHGTGDYAVPRGPIRYNATRRGRLQLRGNF